MKVQKILDAKGSGEVFTLREQDTLADFVRVACEKNVGAMLVTNAEDNIVGIVTERDILRQFNAGADFRQVRLGGVMTRKLATVQVDDDIKTAMDYMVTLKIRHLPVLAGKELAGLITVRDLIMAMRLADDRETHMLVEYLRKSLEARGASGDSLASH